MPIYLAVIAGLFLLLMLLLCAPIRVDVRAGETYSLTLRYLWFAWEPAAGGDKVQRIVEERPKSKQVKKKAAERTSAKLGITVEEALGLVESLWPTVRRLVRSIKLTRIRLYVSVGGGDAADIALTYGRICAAVGAGMALLQNLFKRVRFKVFDVRADFLCEQIRYDFSMRVSLRPIRLIAAAVILLVKALPTLWKIMFPKKPKPADSRAGANTDIQHA